MNSRNAYMTIIVLVIILPGLYYFTGGDQFEHGIYRDIAVIVQIIAGFVLIWLANRNNRRESEAYVS